MNSAKLGLTSLFPPLHPLILSLWRNGDVEIRNPPAEKGKKERKLRRKAVSPPSLPPSVVESGAMLK